MILKLIFLLLFQTAKADFTVAVRVPADKVERFLEVAKNIHIQPRRYGAGQIFVFERDDYEESTTAMEWFDSLTEVEMPWAITPGRGMDATVVYELRNSPGGQKFRMATCVSYLNIDLKAALAAKLKEIK